MTRSRATGRRAAVGVVIVFMLVGVALGRRLVSSRSSGDAVSSQGAGSARRSVAEYVHRRASAMAAPIEVLLPRVHAAAAEQVFAIFREVDQRMSEWKPSSPLSVVNRAAGKHPVAISGELRALLRRGVAIGARTGGAFDVTWAALWGLWDFKAASPRLPTDAAIAERLALVDYRRVELDDAAGTVYLPRAGMKIGLGGIAKGYALDRAARALRARGVRSFMISAGGQVYCGGDRQGHPWRVGIRDPRGAAERTIAALELTETSISTSGDYERFFVIDGERYHHILDPRTGRPARGARSVTVIGRDATLTDALSTALLVIGAARGIQLVERWAGLEAVIVDANGAVHVSAGARSLLHKP